MPKIAKGRKFRSSTAFGVAADGGKTASSSRQGRTTAVKKEEKALPSKQQTPVLQALEAAAATTIVPDDTKTTTNSKTTITSGTNNDGTATTKAQQQQLSRGQRKRQAKREKYLRKNQLILSCLQLRKQEEQAKRIDGLDAIKEALLATVKQKDDDNKKKPKMNLLKSNKRRMQLVETEVAQFNRVLQHPAFQADPLATVREHLQNSMSEQRKTKAVPINNTKNDVKKKRRRHKSKYRATRSKHR